jgi:LysM repeat protein
MRKLIPLIIMGLFTASCSGYSLKKNDGKTGGDTSTLYEDAAPIEEKTSLTPVDEVDYPVKPGDTLESIAHSTLGHPGMWRHIGEWNKVGNPPKPGTVVKIPLKFRGLLGVKAGGATLHVESRPVAAPLRFPRYRAKNPATVLRVGEKLTFDVKWFAIRAGQATLSVESLAPAWGERAWHVVAVAKSTMIFFFKVVDTIESWSTEDELLPIRFEKHLREGSYKKDIVATFDRKRMVATWGDKEGMLEPNARDLLGAFEYFRTIPLPAEGKEAVVGVHTDRKNYELWVQVIKREKVKVPAGEFNTVCIKPKLKFEGLWRQKGDIHIWLTDDERRIPVLVTSKVFMLGTVDIVLVKMEGTK